MSENKKYHKFMNIIFLIIWGFVLTIPILLSLNDDETNYIRLIHEMVRIFPFLILFLINHLILYRFISKKKYINYTWYTIIAIIGISLLSHYKNHIFDYFDLPAPPAEINIIEQRPSKNQFGRGPGYKRVPPPDHHPDGKFEPPHPPKMLTISKDTKSPKASRNYINFILNILFSLLVIGLNNSIRMAFEWMRSKNDYEELEKENLRTELAYLQHQINPHFFMNTLNNIHALIDFDREVAKNSVQKLAKLMRVLLYDAEKADYTLEKEINFLNDYIELMRIRLDERTEIKFTYPEIVPYIKLTPLLFVSFIENAFKHGIRATGKSFIHIDINISDSNVQFEVSNSRTEKSKKESKGRIGLENCRKRLDLLYNDEHDFEVTDEPDVFKVRIKLPVKS